MSNIELDIINTKNLILGNYNEYYNKIYSRSNEDLERLFQNINVKDKDIYTVLASSDQYFYSKYLGARSVDCFDKNKLSLHYFYLRKWIIEYLGKFSIDFSKIFNLKNFINELLKLVKCSNLLEEKSFKYWRGVIATLPDKSLKKLFYFNQVFDDSSIKDIEFLKRKLKNVDLNFSLENIFEQNKKEKKYDVVILSNILESPSCDVTLFTKCRNYLDNILKDDGVVVCSYVICRSRLKLEEDIFQEKFDLIDFKADSQNWRPVGYSYKKRR